MLYAPRRRLHARSACARWLPWMWRRRPRGRMQAPCTFPLPSSSSCSSARPATEAPRPVTTRNQPAARSAPQVALRIPPDPTRRRTADTDAGHAPWDLLDGGRIPTRPNSPLNRPRACPPSFCCACVDVADARGRCAAWPVVRRLLFSPRLDPHPGVPACPALPVPACPCLSLPVPAYPSFPACAVNGTRAVVLRMTSPL